MVNRMRKELPTSSGVKRGRYKSVTTGTYVKIIACAIQDSPDRMLTFKEIMEKLEPFVFGDRRSIENNIRVCLSSNGCFTKVPVDPHHPNPKKNYWRVDEQGITPKMLRRHFSYIIDKFPGLSQKDTCGKTVVQQSIRPICNVQAHKSDVKFTGPFSIDSILNRDHNTHLQYEDTQHKTTNAEDTQHKTTNAEDYTTAETHCGLLEAPLIPMECCAFPNWLMYTSMIYSVW